jgi:uncharacterized protein YjbI with pentapeptide repeats
LIFHKQNQFPQLHLFRKYEFFRSEFSGGAKCEIFWGSGIFWRRRADFSEAKFSGEVFVFPERNFLEEMRWRKCEFFRSEIFWRRFSRSEIFWRKCGFLTERNFLEEMRIFSERNFLEEMLIFLEAKFSGGYANFYEAEFSGGDAIFNGAQFSGGRAIFRGSNFLEEMRIFQSGIFWRKCDFYEAEFSGGDAIFPKRSFQIKFLQKKQISLNALLK